MSVSLYHALSYPILYLNSNAPGLQPWSRTCPRASAASRCLQATSVGQLCGGLITEHETASCFIIPWLAVSQDRDTHHHLPQHDYCIALHGGLFLLQLTDHSPHQQQLSCSPSHRVDRRWQENSTLILFCPCYPLKIRIYKIKLL